MFDGVPEQFHQFITPRNSSNSLPLHLPFPLQASATATSTPNNTTFPTFDPYNPHHHHHHHQLPLQPNQLLQQSLHHKDIIEEKEENSTSFEIETDQQQQQQQQLPLQLNNIIDPWTNDEVLALLRIRSSMESWFPEFTWEHVSRKLAEVGYKRSADKCKEKFEEETRYFTNISTDNNTNNNNNNNHYVKNNNYRFISELEELYQAGTEKTRSEGQQDKNMDHAITEEDSRNDVVSVTKKNDGVVVVVEEKTNKEKKRKRGENRFQVFKGFCESVVQKMMAQQEEMHNKLLEDMIKRDEEKFNREEAWKKQEMEKMNKELEIMAREQAIACDRHANMIQFLKNLSTFEGPNRKKVNPNSSAAEIIDNNSLQSKPSSVVPIAENQNPSSSLAHKDTLQVLPSSTSLPVLNPSSSLNSQNDNSVLEANSISNNRDDIGRRWPKDEVLALINLRCTSLNNNNEEKEGNNKAPLWERISQGMLELGYKRSAKRCKEKWENINKYFRKTKDTNRKRSIDSRTCPYFHLLSNLYKQGKLVAQQSEKPEGELNAPAAENNLDQQTQAETSSQVGPATGFTVQQVHHGGEKTLMQQQVPSLDFHDQF